MSEDLYVFFDCFGDFNNPLQGRSCEKCAAGGVCRTVVKRELLRPVLGQLETAVKSMRKGTPDGMG